MTYVDIICKNYITHAHRPYVLSNGMMAVVYFLGKKMCFIPTFLIKKNILQSNGKKILTNLSIYFTLNRWILIRIKTAKQNIVYKNEVFI